MVKVIMTRTTDTFVGLSERAYFANRNKADLFVSYHLNAATATAHGYEDYTYPTQNTATINSRNTYHGAVMPALRALQQFNRGKKVANFAVLRETTMPAYLIELGFITNASEYNNIAGQANFELLAQTHASAIQQALSNLGKPNGTVCIDPGHGGRDPGAVSRGYTEADYVLRFALRVREILQGAKPIEPTKPQIDKEVITLTETGRKEIRDLLKKARDKGIINATVHTDDKIAKYNDVQLLSYQAAVINREFK